jgi:RNA polymerase primary sigma factor
MSDMLSSGDDSRTDRQVDYESMQNDMEGVLKSVLKDRELKIVKDCFGIGGPEKGLEEIGEEMGLTRERVRQIREKSIMKIRQSGNAKLLMKYLG